MSMHRTLRAPVLAAVLVLTGLLVPASVLGVCSTASSGFIFLHPHFAGKDWQSTRSSIDLALPDAVCDLQPRVMSFSAAPAENVGVFFASDGSLYTMQAEDGCPTCLCCRCAVGFFDPAQLDVSGLPLTSGSPLYVIRQTGYTYDNVRFAVAGTNRRVLVVTAAGDGSSISRVDTLRLSGATVQDVRYLGGALNASTGQDTGLWVGGTRGLLRLFPYNGTAWGTERSYDIPATDTVLCVNDGFAGTWTGRIYARNGAQFVQQARPTNAAVRSVSSAAAVGDSGVFLLRENAAWTVFRTGINASMRHVNLTKTGTGSAAELIDASWGYHRYVYRDSLTRISAISPVEAQPYLDSLVPYRPLRDTELRLSLSDPDGNFLVPSVRLSTGDSLTRNGQQTLGGSQPNAPCSLGALVMTDVAPVISLYERTVLFRASAALGEVDVQCGGCTWTPVSFFSQKNWSRGDTLTVIVGSDTLRIANGILPSTHVRGFADNRIAGIEVRRVGNKLSISTPRDRRFSRLTFLNAAGRTLASFDEPAASIILDAAVLSQGVIYLRAEFADGNALMMPLAHSR